MSSHTTIVQVSDILPPQNFTEFLAWVEELKRNIPKEYWPTAEVRIDSTSDGYMGYAVCDVNYTRPETTEEARQREERERQDKWSLKEHKLSQYHRLKQELGIT